MIEGWGLVAAGVAAVGSVAGAEISSSAQAGAAKTAAQAQESAAQLQAQTQASIANAQLDLQGPSRALGGEAQRQLAYELGLDPNLNISSSFETPQVNTDGTTTFTNGSGGTSSAASTFNPVSQATPSNNVNFFPHGGQGNTSSFPTQMQGGTQTGTAPVTGMPPVSGSTPSGDNTGGPNTNEGGYGSLATNPFQNPANLELSPAYQFNLSQGESVLNNQGAAAGHDPLSTGQFAAEEQYTQGLAQNTYQQAFSNAMAQQTQQYDELAATAGQAQIGNSASGAALESAGAGISGAQGAAGSAAAAGAIGVGNAFTSGIGTGLSSISSYLGSAGGQSGAYSGAGGSTPGYDINGNPGNYNDAGQLITD